MTTKVAVLGAGSWGTTFAKILADGGADVGLWARRPELAREITQSKRNSDYLPGINLPRGLWASSRLHDVLDDADQVYLSVPAQSLRENLRIVKELIPDSAIIVSLMKGVEKGTRARMSEVILQELGIDAERVAVVSGPNLALEIAKEQPTAAVVSSETRETATTVAMTASNPYFRSFVNTDVIGTEFAGVLKNLIAVAIGIVDGVGYGENTKASIITRGLVEITRLGLALGASPETFAGLAGMGDLVATCSSPLSRNQTFGRHLGEGMSVEEAAAASRGVAEGARSARAVLDLATSHGVDMPITAGVVAVVEGAASVDEVTDALLSRPRKTEGVHGATLS